MEITIDNHTLSPVVLFSVDLDSVSKQERKMIAHCPIPATPGSRKTAARVTVGCRICLER